MPLQTAYNLDLRATRGHGLGFWGKMGQLGEKMEGVGKGENDLTHSDNSEKAFLIKCDSS